ncbi:MAG TPA: hypothetical protein VN361_06315 [Oxalicibacterium sp.]|nr:hypothetical protein [Oxalicibacterium sp.]
MATQDTDVATAEVGGDASPGFSSNTSSRNTQQRTPGGFNPSVDGGVNAAQQARVSGAAAMDEAGRGNFDTAKEYAKDAAGRAKEQGRAIFDEQKENAAGTVDSTANAFRNTAQQLRGEGQAQTGQYVEMFADQLQSLGNQLRNKNLDTLIRDAEDFGRRSPGTFLAGSMVAGFVLARFLKSSAEHRHEAERSYGGRDDRSSYADDRSRSTSSMSSLHGGDGALLRGRPNAGGSSSTWSNTGSVASDADMNGSVMEGSDVGTSSTSGSGLAGVTSSPSPIATANESLTEGERHDNR